jgi:predicted RNA-binding protein with EMAP domain
MTDSLVNEFTNNLYNEFNKQAQTLIELRKIVETHKNILENGDYRYLDKVNITKRKLLETIKDYNENLQRLQMTWYKFKNLLSTEEQDKINKTIDELREIVQDILHLEKQNKKMNGMGDRENCKIVH